MASEALAVAQWSQQFAPPGTEVPQNEAWEKARKALEEAQLTKATASTTNATSANQSYGYYSSTYWPQQTPMYNYPGFMGFPGMSADYYQCDRMYDNYANNSYQQGLLQQQQQQQQQQQSLTAPGTEDHSLETKRNVDHMVTEDHSGINSAMAYNVGIQNHYNLQQPKQAPGVQGIRFNLPPRNNNSTPNNDNNSGLSYQQRGLNNSRRLPSMQQEHNKKRMQNKMIPEGVVKSAADQQRCAANELPKGLQNYVARAYRKCKTDLDKDQVEIIIKGKIGNSIAAGTMMTKDWDREPLPNIHSERLEKEAKVASGLSKNDSFGQSPHVNSSPYSSFRQQNLKNLSRQRKNYNKKTTSRGRSRSRSSSPVFKSRKRHSSGSSDSSHHSTSSPVSSPKRLMPSSVASTPWKRGRGRGRGGLHNANKKKNKKPKPFGGDNYMVSSDKLEKRAARFQTDSTFGKKGRAQSIVLTFTNNLQSIPDDSMEIDWENLTVVGTCQDLEKAYLRLTTTPDPSTIRPVDVLRKSLRMVQDHWRANEDYHYACDQLKSIRQDLTVQCVRDAFTVQVYETHARIALQKGDHEEFNQCQAQLKTLYDETGVGNKLEFTGYHILYNIFARNTLEIKSLLSSLTCKDKKHAVVSHALEVLSAWLLGNYHRFFKLYQVSTDTCMSGYLIDWFVGRERKNALKVMAKSYRPLLPVAYVQTELAFSNAEDTLTFLEEMHAVFADPETRTKIDCKESQTPFSAS